MVQLHNFKNAELKQTVQRLAVEYGIKSTINVKQVQGMSDHVYGCMAKINNSYWICLSPDCPAEDLIKVVAHEMVHVWQHDRGDLDFDYESQIFYWKGQKWDFKDLEAVEYYNRPWEKEAKELEK